MLPSDSVYSNSVDNLYFLKVMLCQACRVLRAGNNIVALALRREQIGCVFGWILVIEEHEWNITA